MGNIRNFTDTPAEKDLLEAESYIKGLAEFIENCDDKMTISIRGEWGTGKTSLLKQLDNRFKNNNCMKTMWFNTWELAELGYRENMIAALLDSFSEQLIERVSQEHKNEKNINYKIKLKEKIDFLREKKSNISALINGLMKVSSMVVPGMGMLDMFGEVIQLMIEGSDIKKKKKEKKEESVSTILNSTVNIQEMIDTTLDIEKNPANKLIIFIDDLDRLSPDVAVNLLEGMKVFLDCSHCIFILAIDDSVIYSGITKKYDLTLEDQDKAKMFFDKIIQVPFRMPVEKYDYRKYIGHFLGIHEKECQYNEEIDKYLEIINSFSQNNNKNLYLKAHNPRTIKRAFNLQKLNETIYSKSIDKSNIIESQLNDEKRRYMFAKHLLEIIDEEIFNELLYADENKIDELMNKKYPFLHSILDIKMDNDDLDDQEDIMENEDKEKKIKSFLNIMKYNLQSINIPNNLESMSLIIKYFYNHQDYSYQLVQKSIIIQKTKTEELVLTISYKETYQCVMKISVINENIINFMNQLQKVTSRKAVEESQKACYFDNTSLKSKNYSIVKANLLDENLMNQLIEAIVTF